MRIFRLLGLLLSIALPLSAQVTVELVAPQGQFLPGEPIFMAVKITNRSGQPVQLGADNEWLSFTVDCKNGYMVERLGDPEVLGPFTLESGKMATRRVDITPAFRMGAPGHYSVTATVSVKDWGRKFTTAPAEFDIIKAVSLRELEFGVPSATGQAPEVRKYSLQQARFEKNLELYVRVSDVSESRLLRVTPLGAMVSFSEPEVQVDRQSNLHVMWQTGARSFVYREVNTEGQVIARQKYEYVGTRPKLGVAEDGSISVRGGVRQLAADDLPPVAPKAVSAPVAPVPVAK